MGVGERPESVVVLLAGRVPEAEVDGAAVDDDVVEVVVEHGGDVLRGEVVLVVADQHTRFAWNDSEIRNCQSSGS